MLYLKKTLLLEYRYFFSDHILSHIQELPAVTLFLRSAPVSAAPLDRVPMVRATGPVDFFLLDTSKEEKEKTNNNELNACVRRSLRKVNLKKIFF